MSYNFHIRQDVVAIVNHSQGYFKENDTFKIKSLKINDCKCTYTLVDIGLYADKNILECPDCGFTSIKKDNTCWFASKCFAPLDELTDISELQEVLEQPLFQVK